MHLDVGPDGGGGGRDGRRGDELVELWREGGEEWQRVGGGGHREQHHRVGAQQLEQAGRLRSGVVVV